jgi:D-alanine transaminase
LPVLVYLNGEFVRGADARISVDDRGFLFADGVYEVARVYDGRIFLLEPHLARMAEGLQALEIRFDGLPELAQIAERLLDENGLRSGDAMIYVQVTRGAAPRAHRFPAPDVPPTVFVAAKPFQAHPARVYEEGAAAITVPDTRWSRCDIKSVSLLPNVLANEQAQRAGAFEAIFVRDGIVLEGSHSNLMAVFGEEVVTYPSTNYILPGITRREVLRLAAELGIPAREGVIPAERIHDADELFLTGTTTEVMPITRLDGRPVGGGRAGPIARRLQEAYRGLV